MTILVDRESVRRLLDIEDALELARQAHVHAGRGEAFIGSPGRLGRRMDGRSLNALCATYSGIPVVGMHSSYSFRNEQGRLQTQGCILLHNFNNGQLAAVVEASLISQMARACNAALATDYLKPAGARIHTIIADQVNSRQLARAVARVSDLEECRIAGMANSMEAKLLAEWIGKTSGLKTLTTEDIAAAVSDADIISIDASAGDYVLSGTQLRPGTHVNSLGATEEDVRELDTFAVQRCKVICDHLDHSRHCAGNLLSAIREEKWSWERLHGELGQVITGDVSGRTDSDEITLFNGSGMPLTEVVLAWEVQLRALEGGVGQTLNMNGGAV